SSRPARWRMVQPGSPSRSFAATASSISAALRTAWKQGCKASWWGAFTGSICAGPFLGRACFITKPMPPRWLWSPWSNDCAPPTFCCWTRNGPRRTWPPSALMKCRGPNTCNYSTKPCNETAHFEAGSQGGTCAIWLHLMSLSARARKQLSTQVESIVASTPVHDIHTHLYDPAFGDMLLWGIDDLLVYHYLVAESFRYFDMPYEKFWGLSKTQQADLIWDALFIKNSPISEACR